MASRREYDGRLSLGAQNLHHRMVGAGMISAKTPRRFFVYILGLWTIYVKQLSQSKTTQTDELSFTRIGRLSTEQLRKSMLCHGRVEDSSLYKSIPKIS